MYKETNREFYLNSVIERKYEREGVFRYGNNQKCRRIEQIKWKKLNYES